MKPSFDKMMYFAIGILALISSVPMTFGSSDRIITVNARFHSL